MMSEKDYTKNHRSKPTFMEIDVTQLQMGDEFLYSVQGTIARAKVIRPVVPKKVQPTYRQNNKVYYKSTTNPDLSCFALPLATKPIMTPDSSKNLVSDSSPSITL